MIRIGLRDARAHLRRFVMSIIAIALGVAFVVGSFCFRAMLDNQVADMMATNSDADVYVRGDQLQRDDENDGAVDGDNSAAYNDISPDLVSTIRDVEGVDVAEVRYSISSGVVEVTYSISSGVVLVGHDGEAVSTMASTTIAIGIDDENPWRSATLTEGHWPADDGEIALDEAAAEQSGLKIGDTTTLVIGGGPTDVTVTGLFSTSSSEAGAILLAIAPSYAEGLYQKQADTTDVTWIDVYATMDGTASKQEQQELADRINAALPADAHAVAVTGDAVRDDATKSTQEQLGFIQPLILIFAIIALFVGSFIIANTFAMIVRDAMRGYALLRSIGASPAQIFMTVIIQAIVLGLIGSVIGIALGWGLLELIKVGLDGMGMPLSGSVTPSVSDMLIGLVVGVLVTILGATLPAKTAATAPPIQAMNETVNPEKPVKTRAILGAVMVVIGAAIWYYTYWFGTAGSNPTGVEWLDNLAIGWPLGIGAAFTVLGVIVLAPALVAPAEAVLGWIPSHIWTVTGRLATRNISRAKRRTANTATALFVGLAIVSCLGVVASSAKVSVDSLVDNGFRGDFVAMNASGSGMTDEEVDAIEGVDGVKTAVTTDMLLGLTYDGEKATGAMTVATRPEIFTEIFEPETSGGDAVKAMEDGQLVVGENAADKNGWTLGQTLEVTAEQTSIDEEATKKAQEAYQSSIESQAAALQAEAQRLAAAGDADGAQAKAAEAQQVIDDAKNADPEQFVKTKTDKVTKKLTIGAILTNSVYRNYVFVNEDLGNKLGTKQTELPIAVFLVAKDGTDLTAMQEDLVDAVKPFYVVSVMNRDEYKSTVSSMIDQVLMILYALLALSIIIAIFGIVNTLALNVSERTKEIGLLRAIGTSRGQVRGMLAIEAAIISVFGTLLGIVVGTAAGAVIRAAYSENGLNTLSIPWGQLCWFLALSIVVGLAASVSPAGKALKQPVLDAVASE